MRRRRGKRVSLREEECSHKCKCRRIFVNQWACVVCMILDQHYVRVKMSGLLELMARCYAAGLCQTVALSTGECL